MLADLHFVVLTIFLAIISYSEGDLAFSLSIVSCGLLIQRSREMVAPNVPGTFTVKLYSRQGLVRVIGVLNEVIRNKLITYIHTKGGEGRGGLVPVF